MNKYTLLFLLGFLLGPNSLQNPLVVLSHAESKEAKSHQEAKTVLVQVEKGMSLDQVALLLKERGLITNIFYFKLLARVQRKSDKVQSGEYVFQKGLSSQQILNILVRGQTRLYHVTFPEGYNMYEMAELLDKGLFLKKEDFVSQAQDPDFVHKLLGEKRPDLEGYLFPDTYHIPRPVAPKALIRKMVQNFFKTYKNLNPKAFQKEKSALFAPLAHQSGPKAEHKKDPVLLSRHELVILASIVEKETGLPEERTVIASVFYNRLRRGQRLESDPTILYGMMKEKGGLIELNIRKKDILRKTPYNTYRIGRFPAGPIGNPGAGALKAVLKPADSAFLYFVSRNDGSHVFSKSYAEHKKAVNRYQKRRRARP